MLSLFGNEGEGHFPAVLTLYSAQHSVEGIGRLVFHIMLRPMPVVCLNIYLLSWWLFGCHWSVYLEKLYFRDMKLASVIPSITRSLEKRTTY